MSLARRQPRPDSRPHGQIRQSQVVTTFGPGSLLDLPRYSVLVGGLDLWWTRGPEIEEERLVEKLERILEIPGLKLFAPPPYQEPPAPGSGITVYEFPEWFVTQDVEPPSAKRPGVRSRLLVHRLGLTRRRFIDRDRKKRKVVPIRFVRACKSGHIGDIDWYAFVHGSGPACQRQLWIDELGTSGDLSEVEVRCECGKRRGLIQATRMDLGALGNCDGSRPWLGPFTKEGCGTPNRLLVRTASNAYFSQTMKVISLPARDEKLAQAVSQVWEFFLQYVKSPERLQQEQEEKPPVAAALEGFSDQEVWAEIQARRGTGGEGGPVKSVKEVEFETLIASKEGLGEDVPDGRFYARALPEDRWAEQLTAPLERVVLVHRLREVTAQVGFTRFESSSPDVEGELEIGVKRAALARETSWLPALENRGEGVFLAFKPEAIAAWLKLPKVKARGKQISAGFDCWLEDHPTSKREPPSLPYVMLHSLAHLLITAVALDCGYPASSIRERVYAGSYGYGILLYTGTPDAEGTLGGLVEVGRKIARHLESALEMAALCSNDPVCAQHDPGNTHERSFLLGSACHGCLLIAETSCEQRNDFLDRALVAPTIENLGAEFFRART